MRSGMENISLSNWKLSVGQPKANDIKCSKGKQSFSACLNKTCTFYAFTCR